MNLGHYNKFWVALIPLVTLLVGMAVPDANVTEQDVAEWGSMAVAVITPILVYAVPNKAKK